VFNIDSGLNGLNLTFIVIPNCSSLSLATSKRNGRVRSSVAVGAVCFTCLFGLLLPDISVSKDLPDAAHLVANMEAAYAAVKDYRASVNVRLFKENGTHETQEFLYTFLKPNWIRMDLKTPRKGWILSYPDKNGEVVVHPAGWLGFLDLHLAPDSSLILASSGQPINQTDMGLLIRNIASSLTMGRRGPVEFSEKDSTLEVQVLADDHFKKGVVTHYTFRIDENLWLPLGVVETTPDGVRKRSVEFHDLRINNGVSPSYFLVDPGERRP
jgi:outer membrane lipoprotein-sorting protein